jgi:putative ABC transport system permease protein
MVETLKFTLRILKKRPLRSLLTILQVGLGVWIVALILSLNFQTAGSLEGVHSTFGETLAKISVSRTEEIPGGGQVVSSISNLRYDDLVKLLQGEHIDQAFIFQELWMQRIIVEGLTYSVQTAAETTAHYGEAMGLELVEGHFFTQADEEQKNRVVLISDVVAAQLFPGQSALGKTINLGDFGEGPMEFEIIGVYKPHSALLEFFISQAHLLFPLGTTRVWVSYDVFEPSYQYIYIKTQPGRLYEAVEEARVLLADRSVDDMEVNGEYVKDSNRFLSEQLRTVSLFLGAFAFIAVLVSAIGILSIMLVSVVERTREIGLRQALGASKRSIVAQILNESLVFSLAGSILGLLAAYFTSPTLLNAILAEVFYSRLADVGGLHPQAALLAAVVAIAMGQLFGLYPAWQAAKLPPVEALREG